MTSQRNQRVPLAGSVFDRYRHVCVFYNSQDEEYRILLPFIKEGFDKGDKTFHIIDERNRPEHLRRLKEVGIDVTGAEGEGQVEVWGWENAHLRPGWFDQHAMLALAEEVLSKAKRQGFPHTRWVANMGWALEDVRDNDELVEYCARLNYVVPKYDTIVVCTYDCAKFSAHVILDVIRCHPIAIIGGLVHENPFFVPPDELLQEFQEGKRHGVA